MTADIETLPLYVRDGGIVALGPALNYVDERPTDEVTLCIAPFAADGERRFAVPADDESIAVYYSAVGGEHRVVIAPSQTRVRVETLGANAAELQVIAGG